MPSSNIENVRRRLLQAMGLSLASLVLTSAPAMAQNTFPTKTVRIICAFPPGNASDIVARIIGNELSKRWGEPVIVENRPGASGMIAANAVLQAPADGYTLLMTSTSFIVNASVIKNLSYDFKQDFSAVSLVNSVPVILLVRNDFPATNMQEWIQAVEASPGKYTYGHPGIGTLHNLTTKLLQQKTGTDILEIPYNGSVQALTDIIGGNTDMMFEAANSAHTYVQSGKVRALATSGPSRYYALPDVPTMKESGVDISSLGFTSLVARSGTPRNIIDFINHEVQVVLQEPVVQQSLQTAAMELHPPMEAQAVQQWFEEQAANWAQVASSAGIKPN